MRVVSTRLCSCAGRFSVNTGVVGIGSGRAFTVRKTFSTFRKLYSNGSASSHAIRQLSERKGTYEPSKFVYAAGSGALTDRLHLLFLACGVFITSSLNFSEAKCETLNDNESLNESSLMKEEEEEEEEKKEHPDETEKSKPKPKPKPREKITAAYAAVMLDTASVQQLKEKYPPKFENEFYHHMTVIFAPTDEEIEDMDDLLDNEVSLKVIAIAEDEHCQALLVESEHLHIHSKNRFAHVTLSAEGGEKYSPVYSNALFERIFNSSGLKSTGNNGSDAALFKDDWTGILPRTEKYPESTASIKMVDAEIKLNGSFCLDSKWNGEESKCEYTRENQCGFCLFMKGGPCRQEFIDWEKCVGVAKDGEEDEDFVDRCAPQTLMLKTCVDSNPEYYYIVSEDKEEDGEKEEESKSANEAVKEEEKNE